NVLYIMLIGFFLHFIPHSVEEKIKTAISKMPLWGYITIGVGMVCLFMQIKTAEPIMPVYLQF
ncbi:MAG TPA: hypothetical protein VKH37_00085, partial [Ferruginibacter sp.]|nr:hypothetical protein [Ferruginibacter sp.]